MTKEEYAQREVDIMEDVEDMKDFIYHHFYSRVENMTNKQFKQYVKDINDAYLALAESKKFMLDLYQLNVFFRPAPARGGLRWRIWWNR